MKPSIETLNKILYSPSQYVIPVFQRNYRWEKPQWDKLWENLLEIQKPDKRGNHFMGFFVFVPGLAQPGQTPGITLSTASSAWPPHPSCLVALRNIARTVGQRKLADEIHHYYLVHPLHKGDEHYRLLPKERDHDSYLSLVNARGEPSGRMADALKYFEESLTAYSEIRLSGCGRHSTRSASASSSCVRLSRRRTPTTSSRA